MSGTMWRINVALAFPLLTLSVCLAQGADQVEIELMTHAEVHNDIHKRGKSTVLIFNGGTEQRGPQAVLGGHTFMARRTAVAIARRLGNALLPSRTSFLACWLSPQSQDPRILWTWPLSCMRRSTKQWSRAWSRTASET